MSVEQQGDDLPLTEDAEKDRENASELFVENVTELKHSKARAKAAFTKARHALLVHIQQKELTLDAIQEAYVTLDMAQEEAMEVIEKLLDGFGRVKDYKSSERLG